MVPIETCPNCGAKIKSKSILGSNELTSNEQCELISEIKQEPKKQTCQKCGNGPFTEALAILKKQRNEILKNIQSEIDHLPIITTHSPLNWEYDVLGMATGKSTTGTGLFSEFTSSFTDMFGLQSSSYNQKIAQGETFCAQQIRSKALKMGGNAIIATDIDYSELGSIKGMIMVCMSGTVINLNNLEVLDKNRQASLLKIKENKLLLDKWTSKYPELMKNIALGII